MITETWRSVPGYEGSYEVSDLGRVRSLPRDCKRSDGLPYRAQGRILRQAPDDRGYLSVSLSGGPTPRNRRVHLMVLEAFVGPRPAGLVGCHTDDVRTNNTLSNLRWDTYTANSQDTVRNGHHAQRGREACPRGHLLMAPNLPRRADGHRQCLACQRARRSRLRPGWSAEQLAVAADAQYTEIMAGRAPVSRLPVLPAARPGHCRRGHLIAGANVVRAHECRACACARNDRSYARRRQHGQEWTEAEMQARADYHCGRLADAVPTQRNTADSVPRSPTG